MNDDHEQKGVLSKHGLLMLLCCLIPIVAIAAIRLFDIPLKGVLYYGLLLLCPLSHVLMVVGKMNRQRGPASEDKVIEGKIVSHPLEPTE
jgi:hypothetical protein